jgi:hypothetical protein
VPLRTWGPKEDINRQGSAPAAKMDWWPYGMTTGRAVAAKPRIDFPKGKPAVWWPGTQRPAIRYQQPAARASMTEPAGLPSCKPNDGVP